MKITDPVYRLLGIVASINRRLWLIRVNFIPVNIALIVCLAAGFVAGFEQLRDALTNRRTAEPQALAVLLSAGTPTQSFVRVEGTLIPEARLEYGTEGADGQVKDVSRTWAPLFDRGTGKALLVEIAEGRHTGEHPEESAIEGMLRPMPSNLASHLSSSAFKLGGVPVESRFMLVEGELPATFTSAALIAGACGVLLVAFAAAMFRRNVVFQSHGPATADPIATLPPEAGVLVSGRLFLNEKTSQHFANVPAGVGTLQTGAIAIVSNIDASSRFMGVQTEDRSGLWTMAIQPGSITAAENGFVFDGLKKLPAVRFRFTNVLTGRQDRAVLATA